jgi:hypothetical protein
MTDGSLSSKQPSETMAAIKALNVVAEQLARRRVELLDDAPTARMLLQLGASETSPASPPADFLQNVRRNLVAAIPSGQFSPKDLRYAPWLLWNGDPPAASLPGLVPQLLNQARTSGATLRRLIESYLRDFKPRAPGLTEAAACICAVLAKGEARFDSWRIAQNEVHLFDPERGPAKLAALLLADEPSEVVLARYNLDNPLRAAGNYMIAVEDAVRAQGSQVLRKSGVKGLERILQILAPTGELRFKYHAPDTGRALLRAWLDGGPEPAPALRGSVRQLLLQWLGDPRISLQLWAATGDDEAKLMRRWLARASLDLFFRLIDEHAPRSQWQFRHAFWLAYLERGAIADAWLGLGSQVYRSARAIAELGEAYGQLRGERKQCALLLRIGSLVIVEFTHDGKMRAWPAGSRVAPSLGRKEYDSAELKRECLEFPPDRRTVKGGSIDRKGLRHDGSNIGRWQGSAAELIERRTGIRITPREWRPQ